MKTLCLPLIPTLVGLLAATANAQLKVQVSTQKTYRQNKDKVNFTGGNFTFSLVDGSAAYDGCAGPFYIPPGTPDCTKGTSGFLIFGSVDAPPDTVGPYYAISSITPAQIIEPRRKDLCQLVAAPASALPRPLGGFADDSYALYFNLHTTDVREYIITRYNTSRSYTSLQRSKFESEIVPGVYHYVFPRLGFPSQIAPLSATIYPMPEGIATINNQVVGFTFVDINGKTRWSQKGFLRASYYKPNVINWKGLTPSTVIARADSLYLSLRVLQDPSNPNSALDEADAQGKPQSIFPSFTTGGDPRVLLPSPYQTSYTAPPIFDGGTRGCLELELDRSLQTAAITYDFSTRQFQIPIEVINSYADYVDVTFTANRNNSGILQDADGDGYNNLTEWILGSSAVISGSIPVAPTTESHLDYIDPVTGADTPAYFGFTVKEKLGTDPGVVYTLQRSKNGGKTWFVFTSDADWTVSTIYTPAGQTREIDPATKKIQVSSNTGVQPPGTISDLYRVKITLK